MSGNQLPTNGSSTRLTKSRRYTSPSLSAGPTRMLSQHLLAHGMPAWTANARSVPIGRLEIRDWGFTTYLSDLNEFLTKLLFIKILI